MLLGVGDGPVVAVLVGTGVFDEVAVGPGVLVSVLVGTGVLEGTGVSVAVGAGVLVGVITVNVPLLTDAGTGVAEGFEATALPNVSADAPPLAPGKTLNRTSAMTPSEMTF